MGKNLILLAVRFILIDQLKGDFSGQHMQSGGVHHNDSQDVCEPVTDDHARGKEPGINNTENTAQKIGDGEVNNHIVPPGKRREDVADGEYQTCQYLLPRFIRIACLITYYKTLNIAGNLCWLDRG